MSCPINEILPNLFISDSITHTCNNFYGKFNIKLIINCSKDLPDIDNTLLNENKIEYLRIPINEESSTENHNILNVKINETCDKIHNNIKNLSGVLIYCYSANQISPTIVAAYILKYCGITDINLAIYYIRTKRPKCFLPRITFFNVLNDLKNHY